MTRVLPGMQSAFVDIGLDRDAFLYVSDFFEDNDEYDKVVSSVEDTVLKLDKRPAVTAAAASSEGGGGAEAASLDAPEAPRLEAKAPAAEAGSSQNREDREGRDRRGRRSRRRKPKGRGFPESKYAPINSPEDSAVSVEAAEPAPLDGDEEFSLLPGESLAKYSRPGDEREDATPEDSTEDGVEIPVETAELKGEALAEEAAESSEPAVELLEADKVVDSGGAEEDEPVETLPAEEFQPQAEVAADESEADVEPAIEAQTEEAAEAADQVETVEEEGVEPARIPTSLTATLREQNPRYLQHRISRRMRRKSRGGEERPAQEPRAAEPRVAEARPEVRSTAKADRPAALSITDLLREGQEIIVQIAKEPLGQKGARITSHIALPGRYVVYMPTVDHFGVSRKIPSEDERTRLKRILQANRAGIPGGFIVRTAGERRTEEELRSDMHFLYNLWIDIRKKAEKRPAPVLVHHDLDLVHRVLRDQLTSSFKTIWVDNEEVYESVVGFVQRFQPAMVSRVKLYTRATPIFDAFNITQELEKALRPKVWLKSGGYIVINQTEALVAIDINTGKYVGKSNRLEDTIVKTNTDAIREIVRQIRLRDLGGIIVVDFIDMDERKNRQKVMQVLEEAMRADRAPNKILQFNDFGLVAITRKRVKQSLERTLCAPCSYCEGAGYVKSVSTVIGEILQEAQKVGRAMEGADVVLRVHPEVARTLKSNKNDYLQELEEVLGRNVIVTSDPLLHQEKFDLN
ncbi:MAG: Rne/Rng family ribonuclease [Bryobacteraceae bacterium]